jgi:hypothetical protein
VTAANKVYDRTATAALSGGTVAPLAGDAVALSTNGASGSFADRNVGTAKAVTASGYTISGSDAANYALAQPTGVTANITPRALTVTAANATRQEGQPNPSFVFTFDGLLAGDVVPLDLSSLLSTPAGPADPAGTYPIRVREVTAGDYAIRGIQGVLTVSPAARIDANTLLSTSVTAGLQSPGLRSISTAAASTASTTTTTGTTSSAEPNRPAPMAVILPPAPAGTGLSRPQGGSQATPEALRLTVTLAAPQQTSANPGFSVTLPDGAAVPQWVSVDTATGSVTVDPTQANTNALDLRVTVKDATGVDQVRRWLIPLLPEGR